MEVPLSYFMKRVLETKSFAKNFFDRVLRDEPEEENDEMLKQNVEYWKQRCEAAEEFIKERSTYPNFATKIVEAYKKWQDAVKGIK